MRPYGTKPVNRQPEVASSVSSNMHSTPMVQNPGPTMIGERVNTQGSRKVKQLLLADDYDSVIPIATQQVERGAHMLDVQVALTERGDEAEQMKTLVKKLSMAVEVPLIIDVTDPAVAEAALSVYPGRAIINGNNLENGRERIDKVLPIAKKYGSGVLSMTIDEEGMAHTRDKKLAIAQRITEIAVNDYGLAPEDLVFDTLTFPLTTGQEDLRNDAIETLEGIRLIKQNIPGVATALGVSNVSFGITPAARGVLNSVFLYHAVAGGTGHGNRQPGAHHALRRDPRRPAQAGGRPDLQYAIRTRCRASSSISKKTTSKWRSSKTPTRSKT